MFVKYFLCIVLYVHVSLLENTTLPESTSSAENTTVNNTTLPNAGPGMWIPRVISGWPAKLGDVPYQAALKLKLHKKEEYKTFCGAVIIGPTKLITAAHCFPPKGFSKFLRKYPSSLLKNKYAVAGNLANIATLDKGDSHGQWRKLHSVYNHKSYKFPYHDIAVAYTDRPFIFNKDVSPIPIASRNIDYTGKCLTSGYGRTGVKKEDQSEALLLANLDIMPKKVCSKAHRTTMDQFVCTSSYLTDVGKGDSGGPLVCKDTGDPNDRGQGVLVGIVSGHRKNVGSFFTRVSEYQQFIEDSSGAVSTSSIKSKINFCIVIVIAYINRTFFLF